MLGWVPTALHAGQGQAGCGGRCSSRGCASQCAESVHFLPQAEESSHAPRPPRHASSFRCSKPPPLVQRLQLCFYGAGPKIHNPLLCLLPTGPSQVLEAFASWLKLAGVAVPDGGALAASPLVRAALEGLRSSDVFFPATDAVIELIYCTSQRGRPRDDMAQLVQMIVPEVMALRPRWAGKVVAGQASLGRAGCQLCGQHGAAGADDRASSDDGAAAPVRVLASALVNCMCLASLGEPACADDCARSCSAAAQARAVQSTGLWSAHVRSCCCCWSIPQRRRSHPQAPHLPTAGGGGTHEATRAFSCCLC